MCEDPLEEVKGVPFHGGVPSKVAPINEDPIMLAKSCFFCLNGESPDTPLGNGERFKKCLDRQGVVGSPMVSI